MKSGKRMLAIEKYKGEGEEVKKRNSKSNLFEKNVIMEHNCLYDHKTTLNEMKA